MMTDNLFHSVLVMILVLTSGTSLAKTYLVDENELAAAAKVLVRGDKLILKPGSYRDIQLILNKDRLTVTAEVPGSVVFSGNTSIRISAESVAVQGIYFDRISTAPVVHFQGAKNSVLRDAAFFDCGDEHFSYRHIIKFSDGSIENTVENVLMEGNRSMGIGVLLKAGLPISSGNRLSANIFRNIDATNPKGGKEVIQIGQGKESFPMAAHTIVESSVFENVHGDPEAISVKASRNRIDGNLFLNSAGGIVIRGGTRNDVAKNCIGGGNVGLRLHGQFHDVRNNLFVANNVGVMMPAGSALHSQNGLHEAAASIDLTDNVFVANQSAMIFDAWHEEIHANGGIWDVLPNNIDIRTNLVAVRKNDEITPQDDNEHYWSGNNLFYLDGQYSAAVDRRKFRVLSRHRRYIRQLLSKYPLPAEIVDDENASYGYCSDLLATGRYADAGPSWLYQ